MFLFFGNDPQIDLAKFGYNKLNMKVEVLNHLSVFLATYFNHVQKYGYLFWNFGWILAIENPEKRLDFTTFDFQYSFLAGDFS